MTCLILSKEIHEYYKADVQLLKSGCIKFQNVFIVDTGIDPFQSCTIAGACMNVVHTSHLKSNSIGRVPVNGYRSLRNYSNKSMEWITYCEKPQTTQPTSGHAVTTVTPGCANCVEPSRPKKWGPHLPFLGKLVMRTRWMAGAASHKSR